MFGICELDIKISEVISPILGQAEIIQFGVCGYYRGLDVEISEVIGSVLYEA